MFIVTRPSQTVVFLERDCRVENRRFRKRTAEKRLGNEITKNVGLLRSTRTSVRNNTVRITLLLQSWNAAAIQN